MKDDVSLVTSRKVTNGGEESSGLSISNEDVLLEPLQAVTEEFPPASAVTGVNLTPEDSL
jgi:hypothetical protein